MAENNQDKINAFDTLFTNNQIQMLKIILTYMEPEHQKTIAVYIKFMELQYTLEFLKTHPHILINIPCEKEFNTSKLCDEISCFCNPTQQKQMIQLKNFYQNFENMQEMMQMIQMMKEMFPDGESPFGGDPSAMFSGFPGMADMDMSAFSQIFEMFQNK